MDSFELNKIMGAVLGTLLFVMGAGFVAEAIYHPIENRGPGYALPEPEPTEGGATAEAEPEIPLGILLASASVERGAAAARKCQSCHNFGEGEPNKQGPGLYGVVSHVIGSHEGFAYSDALMALNASGETWTYENLNHFLTKPSDFAPGTKMNFAGIRTAEERADILAYLQTLSASPVPFPPPEEAAPVPAEGEAAAPAEGEAAAPVEGEAVAPADGEAVAPAEGTEPEAAPTAEEAAPGAPGAEAPAAAPADAPATQPAEVIETPETTSTETSVEGTPTTTAQ